MTHLGTGRIHFSIHYPDLDVDARKQIWKQFITKAHVNSHEKVKLISDIDIQRLAKHEMNGRQVYLTRARYFEISSDIMIRSNTPLQARGLLL